MQLESSGEGRECPWHKQLGTEYKESGLYPNSDEKPQEGH